MTELFHLLRPDLLQMSAYHVADGSGLIKLDAMENPYPWPQDITEQWLHTLKNCNINRYPDANAGELIATLRSAYAIPKQSGVLLGNGSDELIQILLMALQPASSVLAPQPTFVMYQQVALGLGLKFYGVPLNAEDFSLDLPTTLNAIEEHRPAIIFLAYPNNPTGNLFAAKDIEQILRIAPGLVVVDEAYAPFNDVSFLEHLPNQHNLLVMRTLSKLGLAGLRLGYLCGDKALIDQLNKIRLPYNINSLTQLTAVFALNHINFLNEQTQAICAQRSWLLEQMSSITSIKPLPSSANFILFKTESIPADVIFTSLKSQGVLIKNLAPQGGLLNQCLRVTVGTEQENKQFLQALNNAVQHV